MTATTLTTNESSQHNDSCQASSLPKSQDRDANKTYDIATTCLSNSAVAPRERVLNASPLPIENKEIADLTPTPSPGVRLKALQDSRAALTEIETKHSSVIVATCADTIIPISDKIAIYRNGYKLAITAISLVLVILAVSGVASPVALALTGIVISLVSIAVLTGLVKAGKIGKKDACLLAFMTIASTFAIF